MRNPFYINIFLFGIQLCTRYLSDKYNRITKIGNEYKVEDIDLPVNIEKYENITNMIMQEQALIKGWRKSDNKIRKSILNREKESVTA